jgi:hypothetical protein
LQYQRSTFKREMNHPAKNMAPFKLTSGTDPKTLMIFRLGKQSLDVYTQFKSIHITINNKLWS